MTLPASGLITMNQINIELARPATQAINLNDPACRALAGVPSGIIRLSDFYSKRTVDVVQTQIQQTSARVTTTVLTGWTPVTAGNLIVIELNYDGANGPAPAAPAGYTFWPSGWVGIAGAGNIGIFYKVAAGGETGVNFTHGNSQTCSVMREYYASTIAFAAPVTGTSINPDPPAITPAAGFKSYLFVAGAIYGTAGISSFSAGYPISQNGAAATGSLIRVASSGKQITAASENPGVMALSASAPWDAFTYAVA